MKAYFYDEDRFYTHSAPCQLDPLESEKQGKNVYLTPANSTSKKPTIKDGAKPRWNGTDWEQYPDDKVVYGYTANADGTINYYGENHLAEELQRINKEVTLSFSDIKPVSVNGIYWLSADDPAYIEAKKAHDKSEALAQLDAQYDRDKADIMNYYTQAVFADDEEEQAALKIEMARIDAQYIEDRKALEEAD